MITVVSEELGLRFEVDENSIFGEGGISVKCFAIGGTKHLWQMSYASSAAGWLRVGEELKIIQGIAQIKGENRIACNFDRVKD